MRLTASDEKRYKGYLKAELEAAAMYGALADTEGDEYRSEAFRELVQAEMRHASRWAEKLGIDPTTLKPAGRGPRVRAYQTIAKLFGSSIVIPWLVRGEAKDINKYAVDPEATDLVPDERQHARVLRAMSTGSSSGEVTHAAVGSGGSIRAAILGVNDGLVSNFSLVMGVAGGTDNADFVLLAGVAGLLAGAFSMAAGEYVSVRSQRDIYEHQISVEAAELAEWPEEEHAELVLIYKAKGMTEEEALRIADRIIAQPDVALETMAREELGLDPEALGSPWGAAGSSFVAFVLGAIVPILPYAVGAANMAFTLSAVFSAAALVLVGAFVSVNSGRSAVLGGARMLFAGGLAAAVTYSVGRLIGVAVLG
ncbi:MAG TPA: rubrerythrin family protein [Dehalococcoidia bacterium]|nr:VIT1/CCC1 transporter family protein [SAR202 cluster bacterium]MDP6663968.1 VIT1/CCC1 transporter family protein [SAR202 cluster bacterium]MDP6801523.1 VIT1/CCC1 transporter family protein [SAR202 cluster bacterium]MQG58871.1 rubrerythrin family protein [SAR202 cluster bacterium]HAL48523.1 rubrerythrin family protein [Dehalococcoidia bacterium]